LAKPAEWVAHETEMECDRVGSDYEKERQTGQTRSEKRAPEPSRVAWKDRGHEKMVKSNTSRNSKERRSVAGS
jgi:hypothetical protein